MDQKAKAGLLPLYLRLYDKTDPGRRRKFAPFLSAIASAFRKGDIEVLQTEICCVASEFEQAVSRLEHEDVDLIVAIHLAYSPSLEAADALASSDLPLLFLDTTMDPAFGPDVAPSRISYNHGIHGVQDLASVLRRRGRPFEIAAGHFEESDVLARARNIVRAAHAARRFRNTRAMRIGSPFAGMGDFAVDDALMRDALGITVDQVSRDKLAAAVAGVPPDDVAEEMHADQDRFSVELDKPVHERSVRVSLGLRELLDRGRYSAFSMNFLAFDSAETDADCVPFLEASKAMRRGIGYGGEGDVLTASLVGALSAAFGRTTFTEIFCPDWRGGSLFVSHMGEMNPDVASGKPRLIELDFPYTPAKNPAVLACCLAPGEATLVNLAPGPRETFGLVAAKVTVLPEPEDTTMRDSIRGWIRPDRPLTSFLEEYSRAGGTHHSALVYGDYLEAIRAFAGFANLELTAL